MTFANYLYYFAIAAIREIIVVYHKFRRILTRDYNLCYNKQYGIGYHLMYTLTRDVYTHKGETVCTRYMSKYFHSMQFWILHKTISLKKIVTRIHSDIKCDSFSQQKNVNKFLSLIYHSVLACSRFRTFETYLLHHACIL